MALAEIIQTIANLNIPWAEGWAVLCSYGEQLANLSRDAFIQSIIVQKVTDLFLKAKAGAPKAEIEAEIIAIEAELSDAQKEELRRIVRDVTHKELKDLPEDLADRLIAFSQQEVGELKQLSQRTVDLLSGLPFPIFLSVGALLSGVPRVAGIGLRNVVDRPESDAILEAFSGKTRQIVITGKALSGKSFLAFKVAQKWIHQGGTVAWMQSPTLTSINIQHLNTARNLLLVWDPVEPATLDENAFAQLQQFVGRVLITTRTGDRRPAKRDAEERFDSLLSGYGFQPVQFKSGRLSQRSELIHFTIGPHGDLPGVIAANAKGRHPGFFTITDDGREALSRIMKAGQGGQETTLLGLCQACLMALQKRDVRRIDEPAVLSLLSKDPGSLREEEVVEQLFSKTVDDNDRKVLRVFQRLRHWTGESIVQELIVEAALGSQGIDLKHQLNEMTRSGVLLYNQPNYTVWHDLQLDVLGEELESRSEDALQALVATLVKELEIAASLPEKEAASKARAVEWFGTSIQKLGRWNEAKSLHFPELNIFRRLAQERPQAFLPDVAASCNNLGVLLAKMGKWEKARKLFQDALGIYRDLAQEQPQVYLPDVATICNNLGNLLAGMGEREEARKLYQDALGIYRQLAQEQPKAFLPGVAMTCNNQGLLLAAMGDQEVARKLYQDALGIYRDLAQEQPQVYLPDVATICNNLGNLLAAMGEREEARKLYQEALEIRRDLARERPKAYLPYVATICNNLGNLLRDMGERGEARKLYQEALGTRRQLAQDQPQAFLPDVAMTCNNLGILLANMGEREEARKLYQEAIKIYRRLAREQSKAFLPYVAGTCNNLGLLLAAMGNQEIARELYQEALGIYRQVAREQPKAYPPDVAGTCNNLGNLLTDMGELRVAADLVGESLLLYLMLFLELPAAFGEKLSIVFRSVQKLCLNPDFSDSEKWLRGIWENVLGGFGINIIGICKVLGDLFNSLGKTELAMEPYIFAGLALKDKNPEQAEMAFNDAAELEKKMGDRALEVRSGVEKRLSKRLAKMFMEDNKI